MIKRIIVSLALLASSVVTMAQFQVGANIGASLSGSNLTDNGRNFSTFGAFYPEAKAGYIFNPYLTANLGVGYAHRGFSQQPAGELRQDVDLSFFTFPVYATGRIPLGGGASFGVSAGVQFNAFCGNASVAPFYVRYQEMNAPVGFLCGAQLSLELVKNVNLDFQYRFVTDFNNADVDLVLGRLHSSFFMLGLTYVIQPKEKDKSGQ